MEPYSGDGLQATILGGSETVAANTRGQVIQRSAIEHGRIIEADGARHAVAELRGVLDVVDAGDGVMTAEQERSVVARISMPRRRVSRSRLTEGEARELDEHALITSGRQIRNPIEGSFS